MKTKYIYVGVLCVLCFFGGVLFLTRNGGDVLGNATTFSGREEKEGAEKSESASNVSMVDGKQIIEVRVKGGVSAEKECRTSGSPDDTSFCDERNV